MRSFQINRVKEVGKVLSTHGLMDSMTSHNVLMHTHTQSLLSLAIISARMQPSDHMSTPRV